MLHFWRADNLTSLADALAEVLSVVPDDPLTPEWIAVPSEGMRRWLMLEMARRLGATSHEAADGVATNWIDAFPGSLRTAILAADRLGRGDVAHVDPWSVPHLAWEVLAVALASDGDVLLEPIVSRRAPGATYSRARRVADLFDRYALSRPSMLRAWSDGEDLDAMGVALNPAQRWQPHLWRLLEKRLGRTSPAHRLDVATSALRAGNLEVDLPQRLIFFGISTLPGGPSFLDLVDSVSVDRSVHLFVVEPSPEVTNACMSRSARAALPMRSDDPTAVLVNHPIVSSWGSMYRESSWLRAPFATPDLVRTPRANTLLGHIQDDIVSNRAPRGECVVDANDDSIVIHACAGSMRQVEALRNTIVRLLADQTRRLLPEDFIVLATDLATYAPMIESVFASEGAPSIPIRVTDRSLRRTNPALEVLGKALELIGSRFTASKVLEFFALEGVRTRLAFGDDDLDQIARWVEHLGVRWGLGAMTREQFRLPPALIANTWDRALDSLYLGIALSDDDEREAMGHVFPFGVEGDELVLLGQITVALGVLEEGALLSTGPRPLSHWCMWLNEILDNLVAVDDAHDWWLDEARQVLTGLEGIARSETVPTDIGLDLAEIVALVGDAIEGSPGHPSFFRGGVTVTSMTPMQWIPFKVVCLIGVDSAALGAGAADGDDLVARHPRFGDRDPASEGRQAMLAALLSAQRSLQIFRTGFDAQKNRDVEPPVILAELLDAMTVTLASPYPIGIASEFVHPRHEFDPASFIGHPRIAQSVDATAFSAAKARAGKPVAKKSFLEAPLAPLENFEVDLDDLRAVLLSPLNAFVERRLGVRLRFEGDPPSQEIPIKLSPLERSRIGSSLAKRVTRSQPVNSLLDEREGHDFFPPGVLGLAERQRFERDAATMQGAYSAAVAGLGSAVDHLVAIDLGSRRVVGTLEVRASDAEAATVVVTYRRLRAATLLDGWLDLLVMAAAGVPGDLRASRIERSATSHTRRDDTWSTRNLRLRPTSDPVGSARRHLEALCALFDQAMREPLPLFPELGRRMVDGHVSEADWSDGRGKEGDSEAVALVFGGVSLTALRALHAEPRDPGSGPHRVERLARFVWEAFDRSVIVSEDHDERDSRG